MKEKKNVYPAGQYEIATVDPLAVAIVRQALEGRKVWIKNAWNEYGASIEVWENGGIDPEGKTVPVILVQVWENMPVAYVLRFLGEIGLKGFTVSVGDLKQEIGVETIA